MTDLISYKEMCSREGVGSLQRGMHYREEGDSIILMSRMQRAPYADRCMHSRVIIEYIGHDKPHGRNADQEERTPSGRLTTNGKFKRAIARYKEGNGPPVSVRVYEKVYPGVWRDRGRYYCVDWRYEREGARNAFKFFLSPERTPSDVPRLKTPRVSLPSAVKQAVYIRDKGRCAACGSATDLAFDHIVPLAKGGSATSVDNVQLLCRKHNSEKAARIQ